MRKFVIIYH